MVTFVYVFVVVNHVSLMMHSEFSLKSFVEVGCLFSFFRGGSEHKLMPGQKKKNFFSS